MKALIYTAPWQMPMLEHPEPQAGAGEVVVTVKAVGICGSDVHGFTGSTGRRKPGIVMGHEFAGVVESVGEGVSSYKPGDRVSVNPLIVCGHCPACRSGLENVCQNRLGIGWSVDGAYAERVKVPERNLRRVPEGLELHQAALVEPLAVTLRAVNLTPFQLGDTVLVVGAGPIGVLTVMALKLRGAGRVLVSDLSPQRLERAKRLGADITINSRKQDLVQTVKDLTDGNGADATIEAVGITPTVDDSIRAVRNAGAVTWIGNSAPKVEVPMQEVVVRELKVQGSYGFGKEYDAALDLLATGRINLRPLIDRVAPLAQGGEIITALAKGEADDMKVILEP